MHAACPNATVFADLLRSDPLMPAVVATAIRRQSEQVIADGPRAENGLVDPQVWFECAQRAWAALAEAQDPATTAEAITQLAQGPHSFLQWFLVSAVEEYGDLPPGRPPAAPDGVDAAAWEHAARRAAQAMALCEIWPGDSAAMPQALRA